MVNDHKETKNKGCLLWGRIRFLSKVGSGSSQSESRSANLGSTPCRMDLNRDSNPAEGVLSPIQNIFLNIYYRLKGEFAKIFFFFIFGFPPPCILEFEIFFFIWNQNFYTFTLVYKNLTKGTKIFGNFSFKLILFMTNFNKEWGDCFYRRGSLLGKQPW